MTGNDPLGWQRRLFEECFALGEPPAALDIPTGLGKTSVIVIWLLALAWQAGNGGVRLPRRLAYVVNRRTVVDQATDIAGQLRRRLFVAHGRALGADTLVTSEETDSIRLAGIGNAATVTDTDFVFDIHREYRC